MTRLVSVIIPARNEAATIARAIEPFLVHVVDVDVEVIVADGRSTDATRAVVQALSARDGRVRLVDNPAGLTPHGLNCAIQASSGDVIVRMDGHAEPDLDYLAACLAVLDESGAWNVGGVMVKKGETRAAKAASAAATSPFGIGGGASRYHLVTEARDLPHVWLGCWPRWVFETVGLFDPEMIRNQDEELNRRVLDAGGTIRFDPSIRAAYQSRSSWKAIFQQYFRYGVYRVRSVQKHPSMLRLRHLVPPALLALIVVAAVAGIAYRPALLVSVAAVVAWLGAAFVFGSRVAKRHEARLLDVVAAYACIHLAYASGFWVGMAKFAPRWFIDRQGTVPTLQERDSTPVP